MVHGSLMEVSPTLNVHRVLVIGSVPVMCLEHPLSITPFPSKSCCGFGLAHNVLTGLAALNENLGQGLGLKDNSWNHVHFLLGLCPSGRLLVLVVLIHGCPALPCKVSFLLTVETFYLGLVKPNSFFVGHVQLPSSILQESSYPHSQHSNVPPQVHLF
ncbi:hypothetical protein Tco_1031469 [Tanacetum coccineum]|uniref:Uncharacterized protein n=1 Tax=Tanacetum coccineum TaxID=301880 RepID=A0ABQ5GA65_9ASTR